MATTYACRFSYLSWLYTHPQHFRQTQHWHVFEICPAALFCVHLEYSSVCLCSHGKGFALQALMLKMSTHTSPQCTLVKAIHHMWRSVKLWGKKCQYTLCMVGMRVSVSVCMCESAHSSDEMTGNSRALYNMAVM